MSPEPKSAHERREGRAGALLGRLTGHVHRDVVLDPAVNQIELKARLARDAVVSGGLAFLEHVEGCQHSD